MWIKAVVALSVVCSFWCSSLCAAAGPWKNGPSAEAGYFPIGVWMQNPSRAARYQAMGINLYIGLWEGPTEAQLAALKTVNMPVFCEQNELALKRLDDPIIVGWLLPDEPDNAQPVKDKKTGKQSWGPPVKPSEVVGWYEKARTADPSRPVLLNLGQGVANDKWVGRGSAGKKEDYHTYIHGGDVISFDVYPVSTLENEPLWMVGEGIRRLREWTEGKKPVWAVLECTAINKVNKKPTPHQVRAQAWLALTKGANGLMYFVHSFAEGTHDAAVLEDAPMVEALTTINKQIHSLASVLNSREAVKPAEARSSATTTPISVLTKRLGNAVYVFAVPEQEGDAEVRFTVADVANNAKVEVIGENRSLSISEGTFVDRFKSYEVHLYKITP